MPVPAPSSSELVQAEASLLSGRYRFSLPSQPSSIFLSLTRTALEGDLSAVLTSPAAKALLTLPSPTPVVDDLFSPSSPSPFPSSSAVSQVGEGERLVVGIALLHAFVQVNWTGPDLSISPIDLFPSLAESGTTEDDLNRHALHLLAYAGEPAYHLALRATFLLLAQRIFATLPTEPSAALPLGSGAWWALRAGMAQQHLLDESVPFPAEVYAPLEALAEHLEEAGELDLHARLALERGLAHHQFGEDRRAAEAFVVAARRSGMEYLLTGAMGRRTKFQVSDLTQLVLLAESRTREGVEEEERLGKDGEKKKEEKEEAAEEEKKADGRSVLPEALALNDDTLLEQTQFTSTTAHVPPSGSDASTPHPLAHLEPGNQPALHPLDQCILLSLCLNIRNTSPAHGLTSSQMSAFVARVITHPRNWSVHTMALLLRSRLESNRSRTVERATLQLQALIEQMPTSDSALPERLRYFFAMPLPAKWEMERELAKRFLSLGVVRSALDIFERLEMWEDAVACWVHMDRADKGLAIVRDLLSGARTESDAVVARSKDTLAPATRSRIDTARQAKLWCLLGDLEPEKCVEHYSRAWDVSGKSSSRAMRSLGGYYFAHAKWTEAIEALREALKINPLFHRTWFVLGCACARVENWDEAAEAFSRCVAIEEEDAESWNNLASVYLRMGEKKNNRPVVSDDEDEDERDPNAITAPQLTSASSASVPHSRKVDAHRALKQGIRHGYDNWRIWQNYMVVSMDVGELSEATRALGRLVEMRSEKTGAGSVDVEVLERLVDAVTRAPRREADAVDGDAGAAGAQVQHNPNEGHGLYPRVEHLFVHQILPRVSEEPRVFRAHARLLLWRGRYRAALDAHLKAYRCGIAQDGTVETDLGRFREAAEEVEELVDVMRNLGDKPADVEGEEGKGGEAEEAQKDWRFQARSLVRTFCGRTKASFGEEKEWERLKEVLDELKRGD